MNQSTDKIELEGKDSLNEMISDIRMVYVRSRLTVTILSLHYFLVVIAFLLSSNVVSPMISR